jgi:hypothetical protein
MRALQPCTMQPPVHGTAAFTTVQRGSAPVRIRRAFAQVTRADAKRALPSSTFADPWAEIARSGAGYLPPSMA